MERKVKFRGKNIHTGEWLYGDYHREGKTHYITKPGDFMREYAPIEFIVDEKTLGQFTGMLDKNGKEIYEGDIILQQGYSGKKLMLVRFEHGAFITGEHSGSSTAIRPMLIQKRCEVLGNIYDNPGLISDKK